MQIDINEIEYCKLSVHFEAEPDAVELKRNEVIEKLKTTKVPGFRPGKATTEAVKVYLKNEINDLLKKEMASEAYYNTISEKNIKPFGYPQFNSMNLDGKKFSCDFIVLKVPEFDLNKYKEFDIPKYFSPISADEYSQKMLEELRVKYGESIPFSDNDFVQEGDSVIINYKVFDSESLSELMDKNGEILTIGKSSLSDFDQNIHGMKVGESREFFTKITEDVKSNLSGKNVKFSVNLTAGSKIIPSPLDDELAKKMNFDNFDSLKKNVESISLTRTKELENEYINNQISQRLVDNHDFKIPNWIALFEAKTIAKSNNLDWDKISDDIKEMYLNQAEKSIKLSLVLEKIRENEPEAQMTDEECFKFIRADLSKYYDNDTINSIIQNFSENGKLGSLMIRAKEENTLIFIKNTCTFVE